MNLEAATLAIDNEVGVLAAFQETANAAVAARCVEVWRVHLDDVELAKVGVGCYRDAENKVGDSVGWKAGKVRCRVTRLRLLFHMDFCIHVL